MQQLDDLERLQNENAQLRQNLAMYKTYEAGSGVDEIRRIQNELEERSREVMSLEDDIDRLKNGKAALESEASTLKSDKIAADEKVAELMSASTPALVHACFFVW